VLDLTVSVSACSPIGSPETGQRSFATTSTTG
jgi:hypothetical protein